MSLTKCKLATYASIKFVKMQYVSHMGDQVLVVPSGMLDVDACIHFVFACLQKIPHNYNR